MRVTPRLQVLQALAGQSGEVYSVVFSPDGGKIASGGDDTTVRVWNTDGDKENENFHYLLMFFCSCFKN